MKVFVLLAAIPFAAIADPLETDFDKIFADNSASIVEKEGGKSVTLPGKIVVSQNAKGEILALDGSPHEAIGCVLRITLQTAAVGQLCPASLTAQQTAVVGANIGSIAAFYSANNIPAHPFDAVKDAMTGAVDALVGRLTNLQCDTQDIERFKGFAGLLTGEDAQQKLALSLSDARLPTVNPCL